MAGFTMITLLALLNGDAMPIGEMRAFVDSVMERPLSIEEERLQRFWHDYYDALRCYYDSLDNIDWVSYYKNGSHINTQGGIPIPGNNRVMFAPVFVSPQMQWAVPNSTLTGVPPQVMPHMVDPYR